MGGSSTPRKLEFSVFLFYNFADIHGACPFYLYSNLNRTHCGDNEKELEVGVAIEGTKVLHPEAALGILILSCLLRNKGLRTFHTLPPVLMRVRKEILGCCLSLILIMVNWRASPRCLSAKYPLCLIVSQSPSKDFPRLCSSLSQLPVSHPFPTPFPAVPQKIWTKKETAT